VRVPGRVVRRGRRAVERSRALRFARLVANRECSLHRRPSHRHIPLRCALAFRRVRPRVMPATNADECGPETSIVHLA
jgi:hypothetical protein